MLHALHRFRGIVQVQQLGDIRAPQHVRIAEQHRTGFVLLKERNAEPGKAEIRREGLAVPVIPALPALIHPVGAPINAFATQFPIFEGDNGQWNRRMVQESLSAYLEGHRVTRIPSDIDADHSHIHRCLNV